MNNAKITTLENGLRIVTCNMPHLRTATTAAVVNTGSRYEDVSVNGISHFLEHLVFKGGETRSAFDIAHQVEMVGSSMNAYTSKEKTAFYIKSLSEHIELSVDIIADLVINASFPQEELDRERGVVLQEMAMRNDSPDATCYDLYDTVAYPNQNYGRTILGEEEVIKNVTREDLKNYVNTHYVTGNMAVVCAGLVDHDNFVELVKKYFANLPVGTRTTPEKAEYVGGHSSYNKNFDQVNLLLGFKTCTVYDDDDNAYDVLSDVLGGGMSSPLFTEVREKRGLVYSVSSFAGQGTDQGDFGIYAGTTPENLDELFDVVCTELKKLTSEINEHDLLRSKNQIKARMLMSLENPFNVVMKTVSDLFTFGYVKDIDEEVKKIEAITADDLKRVASNLLSTVPTLMLVGGNVDSETYYNKVQTLIS